MCCPRMVRSVCSSTRRRVHIFSVAVASLQYVQPHSDQVLERGFVHNSVQRFARISLVFSARPVDKCARAVGWFNYYTTTQLPNFLLALPVVSAVLGGIIISLWTLGRRFTIVRGSTLQLCAHSADLYRNVAPSRQIVSAASRVSMRTASLILPFLVHALALCVYGVLVINVQVLTRLLAASTVATHWVRTPFHTTG